MPNPVYNKKVAHRRVKKTVGKLAAHIDLPALHEKGDGPPKDFRLALECYLAAILGDMNAKRKVEALMLQGFRRSVGSPQKPLSMSSNENNLVRVTSVVLSEAANQALDAAKPAEHGPFNNAATSPTDTQRPNSNLPPTPPSSSNGTRQDFVRIHASARYGETAAQLSLGDMYWHGQGGIEKDHAEAMVWYFKAAGQGDAVGQCRVGDLYHNGRGVTRNHQTAMEWYLKAARQDHPPAQERIGLLYLHGQGVSQDNSLALDWFRKAADQGHTDAQCIIGALYYHGQGVSKDFSLSMDWYLKAAEGGDENASFHLGELYENGWGGVAIDYSSAMKWYLKASSQGSEEAQHRIEELYETP
ncbi:hypothetical protein BGW39_011628 [Mortierella sp. 14UC]|nr:hypothetical protein BGW39_011628 [Mortierella sp. 14UC]